ncbi:nucleotide-binding alpha-beta plait domain-containing protein, partial [Tanacetum coccineum]
MTSHIRENVTKNEEEEPAGVSSSHTVGYYLKHRINEKLIEGLVENEKFNDSVPATRVRKMKQKTYNLLPKGPMHDAILKKKITRKEDVGGNFEIPCNIGGLKHTNALVDQGSDVNVMPLSTYNKLTDERPTETDIRLSLASHSYIYPLGITKYVLVDVAGYVHPIDFNHNQTSVNRSLKMGDLSIDAYFYKIESIANVLKGLGSPMSDEDIINIDLEGLPTKYDNVYGINVHRVPFPDLKMVCSMLSMEEMRLKSRAHDMFVDSTSSSPMVLLANSGANIWRFTSFMEKVTEHLMARSGTDLKMAKLVKVFASLANLKPAIGEEGFEEIKISYMGESWVKLDFVSLESMKMFKENGSIGSWFSCIKQADKDFVIEGRVAWVEIEGIPFKFWSKNTFRKIANRWGDLIDFDDQEDNCYHSKRLCVHTKSGRSILENFKMVYRGKAFWVRASETVGWVPDFADDVDEEDQEENVSKEGGFDDDGVSINDVESEVNEVPETINEGEVRKSSSKKNGDKDDQEDDSLEFPPGYTPKEDYIPTPLKNDGNQNKGEANEVHSSNNHSVDPFGIYEILNNKKADGHK